MIFIITRSPKIKNIAVLLKKKNSLTTKTMTPTLLHPPVFLGQLYPEVLENAFEVKR